MIVILCTFEFWADSGSEDVFVLGAGKSARLIPLGVAFVMTEGA